MERPPVPLRFRIRNGLGSSMRLLVVVVVVVVAGLVLVQRCVRLTRTLAKSQRVPDRRRQPPLDIPLVCCFAWLN